LQQSVGHIIHNSLAKFTRQLASKALNHTQQGPYNSSNPGTPNAVEIKHENTNQYSAPKNHPAPSESPYQGPVVAPTFPLYASGGQPSQQPYPSNQPSYTPAYGPPVPDSVRLVPSLILPTLQTAAPVPAFASPGQFFPAQDVTTTPVSEWLRWSQANINSFAQPGPQPGQQEYMSSANTLMTLSARNSGIQNSGQTAAAAAQDVATQWPTNLYHLSQPGNSAG
jgi:hypothetical protein